MQQKPTKEQMPALIAEVVNRSNNLERFKSLQKFVSRVPVCAEEVIEMAHVMKWMEGCIKGEETRIAELQKVLPQENTEIKLGEAPADPEKPAETPEQPEAQPSDVAGQPTVGVGGVEMSKGSEVLQPA